MLQHLRKYANNLLFKLLLGFLIISFVIAGISGILNSSNKDYVAVINGDEYISVTDFINAKRRQLQQLRSIYPNITPEQIKAMDLDRTILSQLITNKLLEIETSNLGILIDDSIVLNVIKANPMFHDNSGTFDKELFKRILASNNIPEADYVSQIKNTLASQALLDSLAVQITPSEKLVSAINNYNNQKLNIDLITISTENLPNLSPNDKEIDEFYQKNIIQYTVPEYRDIKYMIFSPQQYQGKVNVSDQELQEDLNQHLNQSSVQKFFDYYNVIFNSEEDAKKALSMINDKKKWDSVIKEITKESAKEFLVIKQNANDISEETLEVLNSLKEGENSNLVKSDLGYHIIKLVKTTTTQINVAELKRDLKQHLIDQKIEQAMFDDIKNIEDELASGKTLEELGKQYKVAVNNIEMINEQGQNQQGQKHKQNPEFLNFIVEAFKLPQDQTSELFPISESKPGYFVLSTGKIYPSHQIPLAQVKSDVIKAMILENKMLSASKIGNELLSKAGTANFAAVVKDYESSITITNMDLSRPNETDIKRKSVIPFENQLAIFELKPGTFSKIFQTSNGNFAFAKINSIKNDKKLMSNEEANNIKNGLAYSLTSSINQEFIKYLEQKYKVEVHSEIISQIGE
jgi:peptidyl-prolyl cis-trans isomerase D